MITIYNNAFQSESQNTTTFKDYINNVKNGIWQDAVLNYRTGKAKKELTPAVTPSGFFPEKRTNDKIKAHSGFICLDFDAKENSDLLDKRAEIYADRYLYAGHVSLSGKGLALYFAIDKKKHIESFLALEKYLADEYHIISDPSCKNVSRLRFVSYDPDLHINEKAEKWSTYIDKKKAEPASYTPIYTTSDIDFIFQQVRQTGIDLTNSYDNWLKIGFALVSEFGSGGRSYFHEISRNHKDYNYEKTEKKYTSLLNAGSSKYKISTLFWLAKENGLKIKTDKTETIQRIATVRKKTIGQPGGSKDIAAAKENTLKYLNEIEQISTKEAESIVNLVMQSNTDEKTESNDIEIVIEYIKGQSLKYNIITQRVEISGDDITDRIENSLFLNIKQIFPKAKVSKDLVSSIINSDRIAQYNPFLEFIEKNKHIKKVGLVEDALDCFQMKRNDLKYAVFCGKLIEKWLISLMASIHGTYSLLILVLIGEQGTNKTNFFRNILPDELHRYYAESKLDRDKDDEILMSQKLILVDDEFAGKSKKEAGKLKELSSKQQITARKSYGKYSEDYNRLAVLGGTSNELDVINDPTGNRRVIPVLIESFDFEKFKLINKTELFMELYYKWKKVGNDWFLTTDEIKQLNEFSEKFMEISLEEDAIITCFRLPLQNEYTEFYTASQMIAICESFLVKQKLYHKTFGKVLRKLGFERVQKKNKGYGYYAIKKDVLNQ